MGNEEGNDVVKTTSRKEGMRWKIRGNVVENQRGMWWEMRGNEVVIMVGGVFQIINI